jgi:hypothetical protein
MVLKRAFSRNLTMVNSKQKRESHRSKIKSQRSSVKVKGQVTVL